MATQPRFGPFGERARGAPAPKKKKRVRTKEAGPAPAEIRKKDMTPKALALAKLVDSLNHDFTIPEGLQKVFSNEMAGLEHLRYMNMKTLAAALVYLRSLNNDTTLFTPDRFINDPEVTRLIDKLIPEKKPGAKVETPEERAELLDRQRASLIRYIRAVQDYREAEAARAAEAVYRT